MNRCWTLIVEAGFGHGQHGVRHGIAETTGRRRLDSHYAATEQPHGRELPIQTYSPFGLPPR